MTRLQRGDAAELTFVLPPAPGINSRHGTDPLTGQRVRLPGQYKYVPTAHGARPVLSAPARRWLDNAALLIGLAVTAQGWRDPGGPLAVDIRKSGSRADVDSGIKLTVDGIQAGLGVNDARIVRLCITKRTAGAPCLAVTVRPWRVKQEGAA